MFVSDLTLKKKYSVHLRVKFSLFFFVFVFFFVKEQASVGCLDILLVNIFLCTWWTDQLPPWGHGNKSSVSQAHGGPIQFFLY